jgi:DNA-binding MarR family transcriptional regulator
LDNKGRIDVNVFNARTKVVLDHPRFASAKAHFCRAVPESWLESPFRRTLISDTGAFAVIIAIIGLDRLDQVNGASMKMVTAALEAGGLASRSRIRNYIDILSYAGAINVLAHPDDKRRKRLKPTALLIHFECRYFEAMLSAVGEVFTLPTTAHDLATRPGLVERYLTGVMLRHVLDRFTLFDGFPEVKAFMERRHGYLLMLLLAGEDSLTREVDRSQLAKRFGVSQAHIAAMLADAEAQGWLKRNLPSSDVTLSPDFAHRLNVWIARELTIVGLWIEARAVNVT